MFFSQLFCSEFPWAKESAVSINMTRRTVPIYLHTLIVSQKSSGTSIQTQRNSVSDASVGQLDYIKTPTIMVIRMSKIIMIRGHFIHLGKYLQFFLLWWLNHQNNYTVLIHTASACKWIDIFQIYGNTVQASQWDKSR